MSGENGYLWAYTDSTDGTGFPSNWSIDDTGSGNNWTAPDLTFPNQMSITASAAPVPEPGTWAAAAMLLGGAGFMRWRKIRAKVS